MSGGARIEELVERLEAAAEKLRAGTLGPEDAAAAIEECAALAAEAGSELERVAAPGGMGGEAAPAAARERLAGPRQEPLTGPRQDPLL